MTPTFDYFLTYARNDQAEARALVAHLEAFGITIGCDFRDGGLRPGEPWVTQLEELMQRAASYLILIGERGVDRWVQAELEVALNRNANEPGFCIYPVLLPGISPARLSQFLGRFEAIRLAEDWRLPGSVSLAHLIATLRPPSLETRQVCPFPGLRAFDDTMADFFFGRSGEIQQLVKLLGQTPNGHRRWLQIEGASGSGKSSLARAGLLPAIERGWLAGTPRSFRRVTFRPGRQPLRSLALALYQQLETERPGHELREIEELLERDAQGLRYFVREHTPPEHGLVILLDQLEELFSLAGGDLEPARQLDALLAAALEDTDSPFYLVTTIRSDFLGEVAKLPALVRHLNTDASRYLLPEIGATALTEAVRQPALLAGLRWESESLPTRIVEDAGASPGSLPLVAHVLREMWERDHREGVLTHETYDHLGGVGGALARSADGVLESLNGSQRAMAKKIFLSLVQVQQGSRETQRVLSRTELVEAVDGGDAVADVLARLSGARDPKAPETAPQPPRLLSVRTDQNVELVHEALLSNWAMLDHWMEENREALEIRNDVEDAARAWKAAGRTEDGLPRGKQLAYFRKAESVGSLAREFLAAGQELEERAHRKHRQQRQGLRLLAAFGGVCLLAGIIALAWNFQQLYVEAIDNLYMGDMDSAATPDNALEQADEAEQGLQAVLGSEPSGDPHRLALARIAIARGNAHVAKDHLEEAPQHFDQAIMLLDVVDPEDTDRPTYLTNALCGKGLLQIQRREPGEAIAIAERIAGLVETIDEPAELAPLLSRFAGCRINLAGALAAEGSPTEAIAQLERTVPLRDRLAQIPGGTKSAADLSVSLARGYSWAAQHANRLGDPATAFNALERAVQLFEQARPELALRAFAREQAMALGTLGGIAWQRNELDRARQAYEKIPALFAEIDFITDPNDRLTVFNSLSFLADLYSLDHQWGRAREQLARASDLIDRLAAARVAGLAAEEIPQARSTIELRLGSIAQAEGVNERAREHFERASDLFETLSNLGPAAPAWRYQHLACLDRLARLADQEKWSARLAGYVQKATEIYRGYPVQDALTNDPQVAFLLPRIRAAR